MHKHSVIRRYGLVFLVLLAGCNSTASEKPDIQVDLNLTPSPPVVGESQVELKLANANGDPLTGAQVQLEGNMNHAGMKPSFADLKEGEPGQYSGTLEFTMGGDWFILVTAKTSDGQTVQHKIGVPGVESQ